MQKEAKARIKINKLLEEAGWRFFDDENGKANIVLENYTKITRQEMDQFGNNFEKTAKGFVDFLLLDEKESPLVVLEAKSEDKDPLDGKEQARRYAQSLNVRFIILSNGNIHYFWDLERGDPTVIITFPTLESLKHRMDFKPSNKRLADEEVKEDYIALTQNPKFKEDPRYQNEATRAEYISEQKLRILRPYQLQAIYALQKSAAEGKDRFLFEMATGTGKTLLSACVIKLFLKTGNARRVLFLVDRIELENQAYKEFVQILKNDFKSVIYKENRDDWRKAEIVISTVQTLSSNNKYKKLFSPTDFDLVISDEAHRSIGGNSRAVFEYFVGYKLGLTATPKDYLKNIDIDKLREEDPRKWERRQLLDTYRTFGCESGEPTFRYSLIDGVRDGYLVNPTVVDARTEITTQLLSDNGYFLVFENEEGKLEERTFYQKDFEKKFFSEKTNQVFCKTFLDHAQRDPISGEIGKSIVFCVSQKHASKITQILNQMASRLWPDKYNSDFAVQITSNIAGAQDMAQAFANNNLNGITKWLPGYESSKTRVCVTVGMMTTGYDCKDVLNICLMRPIFSPTDFIQIKGRGTRTYTFSYKDPDNGVIKVEKEGFKLFDFFANYEYFEEKYDYDQVLKVYVKSEGSRDTQGDGKDKLRVFIDEVRISYPDPLKMLTETPIGLSGMKIDWKFFEKFENVVKNDKVVKEKYEQGDIYGVEEYIKKEIFDKPEEYFNLEKLRKAVKADRRITLREFIEKIFGRIKRFKTKDELLEEEFGKFVSIYKPPAKYALLIKNYLKAYITDPEIRDIVEKKEYSRLATNPKISIADLKSLDDLDGEDWLKIVPEYVKDYVSINDFM